MNAVTAQWGFIIFGAAALALYGAFWLGERRTARALHKQYAPLRKTYDEAYWLGHAAGVDAEKERADAQMTPEELRERDRQNMTRTTTVNTSMLDGYRAICADDDDKTQPGGARPS